MPKAQQEITINAPVDRVFSVITDYERYPSFLPEMKAVQVVSRHDGLVLVRFELEIIMRLAYTLRLQEDAPNRVSWRLEDAKMMAANEGSWDLRATGEGGTQAVYAIEIKLRGLIPKSVSTKLVGTTLPQTLQRFKTRVETLA